jgi:hypothetical protein
MRRSSRLRSDSDSQSQQSQNDTPRSHPHPPPLHPNTTTTASSMFRQQQQSDSPQINTSQSVSQLNVNSNSSFSPLTRPLSQFSLGPSSNAMLLSNTTSLFARPQQSMNLNQPINTALQQQQQQQQHDSDDDTRMTDEDESRIEAHLDWEEELEFQQQHMSWISPELHARRTESPSSLFNYATSPSIQSQQHNDGGTTLPHESLSPAIVPLQQQQQQTRSSNETEIEQQSTQPPLDPRMTLLANMLAEQDALVRQEHAPQGHNLIQAQQQQQQQQQRREYANEEAEQRGAQHHEQQAANNILDDHFHIQQEQLEQEEMPLEFEADLDDEELEMLRQLMRDAVANRLTHEGLPPQPHNDAQAQRMQQSQVETAQSAANRAQQQLAANAKKSPFTLQQQIDTKSNCTICTISMFDDEAEHNRMLVQQRSSRDTSESDERQHQQQSQLRPRYVPPPLGDTLTAADLQLHDSVDYQRIGESNFDCIDSRNKVKRNQTISL